MTSDTAGEPASTVLIVGAGPTGLTLANVLARYGVPVRIVEKRAELSRHTKATNLMPRTQELLDGIGLAEPMRAIGGAMGWLDVTAYGAAWGPLAMRQPDTAFPDIVLCGQDAFEAVAAEDLHRWGVTIEFGTELVELAQDGDGCTVTLRHGERSETVRTAYVVGADGHAGTTRSFTRLAFDLERTGVGIRQVDATLTWSRSATTGRMWMFYVDHGFAAVVPLPGGIHRVLFVEPVTRMPEREPTLAEMQQRLRDVAADPTAHLTAPRWSSYTDLTMGIAPRLVDGRVILAGDAGNPILPNGGQGMNTGIGDAFNLGWKLAHTLINDAPPAVLDSYDTERHSLRAGLQRAQHASLRWTTLSTPAVMRRLVSTFGGPLLALGGERFMARTFSELDQNTRKSPLTHHTRSRGRLRAGSRALDATVVQNGVSRPLRHLVHDGSWTLLAFTGHGRHADPHAVASALDALPLPGHVVSAVPTPADDHPVLLDPDTAAHRAYQVRRPCLLLIRPDGYIAARVAPSQVAQLRRYVETLHLDRPMGYKAHLPASSAPGAACRSDRVRLSGLVEDFPAPGLAAGQLRQRRPVALTQLGPGAGHSP